MDGIYQKSENRVNKVMLVANTDWYLYNFRLPLVEFLRQHDYNVVLVSPEGKYSTELSRAGHKWIPWNVSRKSTVPWGEGKALSRLINIYRREKPDLVHHFTVKPVLYGSLAARAAGVKGIVNAITGLGYLFLSEEIKTRLIRQFVRRIYSYALNLRNCVVIFENDTDRQYFISEGLVSLERTRLIEGVGVDTNFYSPMPEPPGEPVVIMPARMLWDKGVGVLVGAAQILKERGSQARVVLVGEPDAGNPTSIDEKTIRVWVKDGLVEWWGWREDMREVYAQCHIVTLPSFREGVPTVLLEAAATARPIIATDVPGCRDVVEHGVNGLLVPPNDEAALAEALLALIEDATLRRRMGAAGRQRVMQKYSVLQINTVTEEVYRSLLESH
ncbi:MAG: glycosyltransferase family 4 protein [Anaerolineales bacterium]